MMLPNDRYKKLHKILIEKHEGKIRIVVYMGRY
jgi:hypothetical protein